MSGTRLHKKSTPLTRRFPRWSKTNYYPKGEIVYQNVIDSDNIDLYVSLSNHYSNDSDKSLYLNDSDYTLNTSVWSLFVSSRVLDSDNKSIANINKRVKHIVLSFDSDQLWIDSDVKWLRDTIPLLPDSDSVDSDLKRARSDIGNILSGERIFSFIDSETVDNGLIIWDSDSQTYKTVVSVRTLNTFGPDSTGNLPLSFMRVLNGTKDQKPDSELNGTIYIVANDSDDSDNGTSFIFNNGWESFISPDRIRNDKKFLKSSGGSLKGPLFVPPATEPEQIVSRKYVDLFVRDVKQDGFGFFDSEQKIDTSVFDSDNLFVLTNDVPSLWYTDKINTSVIGDVDKLDVENIDSTVSDSDQIFVQVSNFSSFVGGNLQLYKNGSLHTFTLTSNAVCDSNVGGTAVNFRLISSNNQNFSIKVGSVISLMDEYTLKYFTHSGDVSVITKQTNQIVWVVDNKIFDYGNY